MPTSDSPPNNPYIAGSPIKGQEMFFGRDDIFEKVRAHLVGEHQDNPIVIYGQRRTGKTSVLYQMGRRLNEYAGEERYVAVLVDLQGFALKSMDNFLLELAHKIRQELRDYNIKIPRPDKMAFKSDAREAFENSFLPMVQSAIGERRLLLMFDEAIRLQETVAKKKLEKEVFDYLRSLMQHGRHISFIFSLGCHFESLLPEYNLMLNVALTLHVSFLDEKAARSLVTEPVAGLYSFDDDAIERLLALTSCHPYFIQVICHTLFTRWVEQCLTQVTVTDVDAVLDEATNLTVVNLKYVWDEASPAEKFVLAAMGEIESDNISPSILDRHLNRAGIYWGQGEIIRALKGLHQREVIDSSTHPRLHVVLIARWLRREKPLTLVREELSEHLSMTLVNEKHVNLERLATPFRKGLVLGGVRGVAETMINEKNTSSLEIVKRDKVVINNDPEKTSELPIEKTNNENNIVSTYFLEIANGPHRGNRFPISEQTVFIGRSKSADIVLSWDRFISSIHLKISQKENSYYIWDLNSTNGTKVDQMTVPPSNGEDIDEAALLREGARIEIGMTRLTFLRV